MLLTLILVASLDFSSRVWSCTETGMKDQLHIFKTIMSTSSLSLQQQKQTSWTFPKPFHQDSTFFFFLFRHANTNMHSTSPSIWAGLCVCVCVWWGGGLLCMQKHRGILLGIAMNYAWSGERFWKSISFSVPIIVSRGTPGESEPPPWWDGVNLFPYCWQMLISNYTFVFLPQGSCHDLYCISFYWCKL